jgi:hypothetical protein
LSKSIISSILSFRTWSNLEIPHLLRRKSIWKACNFFLFVSVTSYVSDPYNPMLSIIVNMVANIQVPQRKEMS